MRKDPKTGNNIYGPNEFRDILDRRASGEKLKEIAHAYGISLTNVNVQLRRAERYFKKLEVDAKRAKEKVSDFAFILEVEFITEEMPITRRMVFADRQEVELFRSMGIRLGYKITNLNAPPLYTAERAWKMIKEEQELHKMAAQEKIDKQLKSMI